MLMTRLSGFDVEVLQEILSNSIKIPVHELVDDLECDELELRSSLKKIEDSGLFRMEGDVLHVNKELRKYFDIHAEKFEKNFTPCMEYLQGLLSQVPIHCLPVWYAIPRTSDSIFQSILEKFLLTPKIYREYFQEFQTEDPDLVEVIQEVFEAPDFAVPSTVLREKLGISEEQFTETLIYLEFNFICCSSFQKIGDHWEEVVTPFHEWREYLRYLENSKAKSVAEDSEIEKAQKGDFAFVRDMSMLLNTFRDSDVHEDELSSEWHNETCEVNILRTEFFQKLIHKLFFLGFIEFKDSIVRPTELGEEWMAMNLEDRAIFLYRQQSSTGPDRFQMSTSDRFIRRIERGMRRVLDAGWISFDSLPLSGCLD